MLWFINRRRIGTTTTENEVNSLVASGRKLIEGAPANSISTVPAVVER
jgi:catabolite regulation protein CreA